MKDHPITWTAPQPLWDKTTATTNETEKVAMRRPAILRYTTDDFMDQFMNTLAANPARLGEFRVVRETWRGVVQTQEKKLPLPVGDMKPFTLSLQRFKVTRLREKNLLPAWHGKKLGDHLPSGAPLKLYQPAHQRYYLVSGCLVCQRAGLPDRKVDKGRQEHVGFVMRRLLPDANNDEHAWVESNGVRYWAKCQSAGELQPGEEVLGLFAVNHTQDDQYLRRLFAGLIPAGKREAYLGAPTGQLNTSEPGAVSRIAARKALLRKEVIEPWKALLRQATAAKKANQIAQARNGIQVGSYFVLLDFAKFLDRYLPEVWSAPSFSTAGKLFAVLDGLTLGANLKNRLDLLSNGNFTYPHGLKFTSALKAAVAAEALLESATTPFDLTQAASGWPNFLFPLADPEFPKEAALPQNVAPPPQVDESRRAEEEADLAYADDPNAESDADFKALNLGLKQLDQLAVLILRALPAETDEPQPAVPLAARKMADAASPVESWFVIRCVYQRPACGPLHTDVVSEPTERFQLAGFFDPDAPARPIRIGLPLDTTPAGLRKFDRNTAFVISDTLCGQIKRFSSMSLSDLMSGPSSGAKACANAAGNFGTICTLSIPIITICALILLMIMVSLLNIVFWWLPYFIMCFPVVGLKAKK